MERHLSSHHTPNFEEDLSENTMPQAPVSSDSLAPANVPEHARIKLIEEGVTALSNQELIELLLRTGTRITGQSASELAREVLLLGGLRRNEIPLVGLRHISSAELQRIPGIGEAKAASILAAIELGKRAFSQATPHKTSLDTPEKVAAVLAYDLMWELQEKFAVLHLDIKNRLLRKEIISIGNSSETLAHPRDVFRSAVQQGGTVRLIVAHNHPSGSLDPSPDDLALTEQLLQASYILGIPLLDHLIVGEGRHISLKATTTLWES